LDEEARLRLIWAPNPQVDPALLDDASITELRHSFEARTLLGIALALVVAMFAATLLRPIASNGLGWLPGPMLSLLLELLNPDRIVVVVLVVIGFAALVDVVSQWLEVHDTLADAVEITSATYPQYYPVVDELRRRFNLPRTRVFFSRTSPMVPYAAGIWEPYVVVFNMGLVPMFTLDEFTFLLGHELGHIKLGHTRMAALVGGAHMKLGGVSGSLRRLKRQFTARYEYAQELSCDRIGVLATRDVGPAVESAIKWSAGIARNAKVDLTTLSDQAEELSRGRAATAALLSGLSRAQPRLIERLLELTRWAGLPKPKPAPPPGASGEGAAATTAPPVTTAPQVTTAPPGGQRPAGADQS
jgi:hypothetical protein